ncbi:hypothetical protein FA95DRAFT_1568537 [Auriscalpium vulgare]|uniref:Uncharacterized protein n=1 Tax=Auriscalpium vulgare TaxID=40419 RepID=A0ACB8SCQ9_9AGAM|nr:hypothetical protein FA95DRAFT_1568537 [Auriscalpium vulgare]
MSSHPSPGPSQPPYANPNPNPSAPPPNRQHKPKNYTPGIAAGAEDAKYKAKYRELKKKVKEIEADNDKLLFKTLQSKRNIQRMRIERAILYERLSAHPPSPRLHHREPAPNVYAAPPPSQHYPPHQAPPRAHHAHHPREVAYEQPHMIPVDPNDPAAIDYYRSHGAQIRVVTGHDGQHITVAEMPPPPMVPPPTHAPPPPPPSRQRHPAHPPPMAPSVPPPQHLEPPRGYELHRSASNHSYSHSPSTSSHSRSHSRGQPPPHGPGVSGYPAPPEHSPPYALHEPAQPLYHPSERYAPPPAPAYPTHAHPHAPPAPPSPRIHSHQRVGPGANVNNYGQPEREPLREARDRERERDWEVERDRRVRREEPPAGYAARAPTPPFASVRGEREREGYVRTHRSPSARSRSGSTVGAPPLEREREYAPRSPPRGYYERDYERRRPPAHLERERDGELEDRRLVPGGRGAYQESDGGQSRSDVEGDVEMGDVRGRDSERD